MPDFDSKQYEWSDVSVAIGGRIINGLTSFEFSKKKSKEYLRGRGADPWAIQSGNNEYEGKLGLWQTELLAMEESSKSGDLLNEKFDVTVAYTPLDGGKTVVKTYKGVEATESTEGMAQGDSHMKIEIPIMFLGVKRQL